MYARSNRSSSHSLVLEESPYCADTTSRRTQPLEDTRLCQVFQIRKQLYVDLSQSKINTSILEKSLHLERELDSNIRYRFNTEVNVSSVPTNMDFNHLCAPIKQNNKNKKIKYLAAFTVLIAMLLCYINSQPEEAIGSGDHPDSGRGSAGGSRGSAGGSAGGSHGSGTGTIVSGATQGVHSTSSAGSLLNPSSTSSKTSTGSKQTTSTKKSDARKSDLSNTDVSGKKIISSNKDDEVYQIVQKALEEFSADKTGKTDFALESAGGRIVRLVNTHPINPGDGVTVFGIPICSSTHDAKSLIRASSLPGECWGFKGSEGGVIIRLLGRVKISSVSVEHISKSMSPTGEIDSAPKDFTVWGLPEVASEDGTKLGDFTYNNNGSPIQYFEIEDKSTPFEYIKFRVRSNYGNLIYTCVYRLRVHGVLE